MIEVDINSKKSLILSICTVDKTIIDKLNKIEAHIVGHKCNNLEDYINGIYDSYLHDKENVSQNTSSDSPSLPTNDLLIKVQEQEKQISSLHEQIEKMQQDIETKEKKIASINQSLQMNQDIIEDLTKKTIDNSEYLERAKLKGKSAEVIIKNQEEKVSEILSVVGIEHIDSIGEPFDSKFQFAEETEITDDQTKHNIVAESINKGFRKGDICIKPQKVVVYKYATNK